MKVVTYKDFQNYGSIFENIKKNEVLKKKLSAYGYDESEIAKGKALYDLASQKIDANKSKTTDEKLAYNDFSRKYEAFKKLYSADRKKIKIIYRKEETKLIVLGIKGIASTRISEVLNDADTLYKQLKSNDSLREPLLKLQIDKAYINSCLTSLKEVKMAYADYISKKGESQQATKDKNKALFDLEKWVSEFYAIAKIALTETPQLLESLGKRIKS